MTSSLLENHVEDVIARLATVADFGLDESLALVFHRRDRGKSQYAILRRQGRITVVGDFTKCVNGLLRAPASNFNPSAEWREITIVVDCDGAIRYRVEIVTLTFLDGTCTNAIKVKADDREYLEWAEYVGPSVRFALEKHFL